MLLLAFVLWLERGAPRPPRLTLVAFLVPVALLTSIPFERLFNVSIFSDTTGLLPLFRVSALVSGGTDGMRVLLVLGALAVMVFAALASTRVLVVGGLIGVALFLGVSTKMVSDPSGARRLPRGSPQEPRMWTGSTTACPRARPPPSCSAPTLRQTGTPRGRRSSGTGTCSESSISAPTTSAFPGSMPL